MELKNLFKRKPSELEVLAIDFLKGNNLKFIDQQMQAQQKYLFIEQEKQRKAHIQEKYEYYKWLTEVEKQELTDTQKDEYRYVSFLTSSNKR